MKRWIFVLAVLLFTTPLQARDTAHLFSIQEALDSEAYVGRLNSDVKLYFGDTGHGKIDKNFGDFVTNKKTRSARNVQKKCEWALLSALLSLQGRAIKEGGSAVVNIRSFYKKNEFSSITQYECHSGALIAGVALKGTVVHID